MGDYRAEAFAVLSESLIKKLNARGMDAEYCETMEDAKKSIIDAIPAGASYSWGGSYTLYDSGILDDLAKKEGVITIDRETAKTHEEYREMLAKQIKADYFLMSTNALSMDGQLVNIDGRGNRTAFLICGPEHVFVIAGRNKIAPDLDSAMKRARNIASPANAMRLGRSTPCTKVGQCCDCQADDSICNQFVITRRCSGPKGRIKVFLVNEDLGY